ncbi:hypothetical protein BZA05DRAFT_396021 [Tricharina praecox]|uniref:uncharacterized protein n=1 Tax=Tricharina praecox TaxID=43433 RepID=UPI00221F68A0|nr:uncharacterized protein BZA05DRAFT_396021 [Tricharina praecox]KAI5853431.1 hypothetical protein BZA05DRAFT_396021 [Tricharina praecox]
MAPIPRESRIPSSPVSDPAEALRGCFTSALTYPPLYVPPSKMKQPRPRLGQRLGQRQRHRPSPTITQELRPPPPRHHTQTCLRAHKMSTTLTSDALPPATALQKLSKLNVYDHTGAATTLPQLLTTGQPDYILTIFIRHFYCGNCQDYIRTLISAPLLSPSALAAHGKKLIIIGCGSPSQIAGYKADLGAPWDIYSDPSGAVYSALGMHKSFGLGAKKPEYITTPVLTGIWNGVVGGLKGGVFSGGNFARNGGEFLWVDQKLEWCHRMANTRDHLEVPQVVKLLNDWPNLG